MPMPTSPTRLFVCDGCGATLPFDPAHAGRPCRCGRCNKVLTVPGETFATDAEKQEELSSTSTKYIGFFCLTCDTRLSARFEDVGKKARCPDCGALTVVPKPPKPRPKQTPTAMHGQQYGVWGVDEAPSPKKLAAHQPKFYPVWCRVCDTLMHAQPKQVGSKLTCPDCGAKTLVKKPAPEKPANSVMVPDGEEYQIDETETLPERPTYIPYQAKAALESEERAERQREAAYERSTLPRNPLVQGVFRMMYRSPLPEAIFALACGLALEIWFVANAMANVSGLAIAIVLLAYAVTAFFGLLLLIMVSPFWLAVLKESSDGCDRLYDPPGPVFLDWAGECFYIIFAGSMAAAPGLLFWKFVPHLQVWAGPLVAAASWLLLFPIFLLSELENGSPLEFVSPRLVRTLVKCPGPWLLFYLQTMLIVGGAAAAIVGLQLQSPWFLVISLLLASTVSFLYFRLLGRLAWWIAERVPLEQPPEDD